MITDDPVAKQRRWQPNLLFPVLYLFLNGLLFSPFYFLNPEATRFLPPLSIFDQGLWMGISQLFLWRSNLDPFRIALEFGLLTALWVMVCRWQHPFFQGLIASVYLLTLCYTIYEAIMLSFFFTEPDFYSQYFLALDGLPFLISHIEGAWWLLLLAIGGLLLLLAALWLVLKTMLKSGASPDLHPALRIGMVLVAAFCLFALVRYQVWTARAEMVESSLAFKVEKNIAASLQLYHDVANFDDSAVRAAYDYHDYKLTKKPNIYLLFVESYGSVLYRRSDYQQEYSDLLSELNGKLNQSGWHSTSNLSESPMWGGGSWMAYSSALFGLRIDNQPFYISLFNKYQVENYPSLARTLKAQGYRFVWLSSISNQLGDQDWAKQRRFHGVDEFLRFQELDYHGAGYGWGASPPDQYALNYAQEHYLDKVDQPLLFFMITQNSHYPWIPQPELADDWQTLNEVQPQLASDDPEAIEHSVRRQNYWVAIDNQLRLLTDFVMSNDDENSLFILIGDHQPPRVSRQADGWATPIHVISKDKTLIDSFAEYGFVPGLEVKSYTTKLHHEGIYSLLMRVLIERYGADQTALPTFLPQGVITEHLAQTSTEQ